MAYIFYLLQLLCPEHLSTTSQKASVDSLEAFYRESNARVASKEEIAYSMELDCLARIVFNESTSEPLAGKILVAQVTMNRVNSKDYPDSVCSIMKEKNAFSFYSSKTKEKKRHYPKIYHAIADKALKGEYTGTIPSDTLFFKNCSVKSEFFNKLKFVRKEGRHCFYK